MFLLCVNIIIFINNVLFPYNIYIKYITTLPIVLYKGTLKYIASF